MFEFHKQLNKKSFLRILLDSRLRGNDVTFISSTSKIFLQRSLALFIGKKLLKLSNYKYAIRFSKLNFSNRLFPISQEIGHS